MKMKKLVLSVSTLLSIAALAACDSATPEVNVTSPEVSVTSPGVTVTTPDINVNVPETTVNNQITVIGNSGEKVDTSKLKYVFLFIGDGMSYPQIQSAQYYLSAVSAGLDSGNKNTNTILQNNEALSFTNFSTAGSAQTYDATSFAPDSASTATSISTGKKTWSGSINISTGFTTKYETIAEKLKKQKGYEIGIITSVNLNHATPAAFYAHQKSRNDYDAISDELIASDFDYFAGGYLLGKEQTAKYAAAEAAGYTVCNTQAEAEALTPDQKAIVTAQTLADGNSMSYEMDRKDGEWALKDYVSQGIDQLYDNEEGFFMMCEGGKIDWACHANDAAATINDTLAFSDAVSEAVEFYADHKDETLIIVTGDHETGGLSIGYAGTAYNTYMTNIKNQKISYAKYDSDYIKKAKTGYVAAQTPFADAMKDVKELFGLVTEATKDANTRPELVLSASELERLQTAYAKTLADAKASDYTDAEKILYGTYTAFSVTLTHILNNKSGIAFTSYAHTGLPTAVFAEGVGSSLFEGYYDNTKIYENMANALGVR